MISALVMFQFNPEIDSAKEVMINTANLNGIITHDKDLIPARLLGKAQTVVQMQLYKKLGEEASKVTVLDVTILNIMNLGYMTDEEFKATPEDTKQQEMAKPGLTLVETGKATNDAFDPASVAKGVLQ